MVAKKEGNAGFYLMQDGTYADPASVKAGKDGVLRNENGVGVAVNNKGEPMTMSDMTESSMNAEAAKVGKSELAPPDVVTVTPAPPVPPVEAPAAEAPVVKPAAEVKTGKPA